MSDERTIEPSPRRIREARGRGMVPSSAELTAAVAVLAAAAALGGSAGALADGVIGLMRGATAGGDLGTADPRGVVDLVRSAVGAVAGPLAMLLLAPAAAAIAAHQIQVGGLFVPALALPDPARLRPGSAGGSLADRLGRALGMLVRAAVLVAVCGWTIRAVFLDFGAVADADPAAMVRSCALVVHGAALRFGLALLAVGVVHYAVQVRRLHARLRMTPEERREEQRAHEGDPSLRSRRRAARDRRVLVFETPAAGPADPI